MYRSLTYSFGSICLGSLLQAIIATLRVIIEDARKGRETHNGRSGCCFCCCCGGGICFCILECLARILDDVMEYFNQWAYVFVGIYGYSYLDSGRKVMELFRAKGWTTIITDSLVHYVLGCITMAMGITNGILAIGILHLVDQKGWHNNWYDLDDQDDSTSTNDSTLTSSDQDLPLESYIFGPLPGKGWIAFLYVACFFVSMR
jgi:hypothetical protein